MAEAEREEEAAEADRVVEAEAAAPVQAVAAAPVEAEAPAVAAARGRFRSLPGAGRRSTRAAPSPARPAGADAR